jgi:hypothetical protein
MDGKLAWFFALISGTCIAATPTYTVTALPESSATYPAATTFAGLTSQSADPLGLRPLEEL